MKFHTSLGFRLGTLVALLLGAFTAAYWVAHHELGAIERLHHAMVAVHDPALDAAYEMHLAHIALGVAVNDALAGATHQAPARLEAAAGEFRRNLALARRLASRPGERAQLAALERLHERHVADAERLVALARRRESDLARVAARITGLRRTLIDALLPVALDPRAAHALRVAVDRLDESVRQFLLSPAARTGWRVDEALKSFQGDFGGRLTPADASALRERAARIDRAVVEAVASTRALDAALPALREQGDIVSYRLATRFEPEARAAMRSAAAAALDRIREADRSAGLLLLAALLAGTVISWLIVRSILDPVRELVAGTRAVARGHYRRLAKVTGGDELESLGAAFNDMARALEETTISRTLFDDILHALDEALFVVDADGTITHANRAACVLTGVPALGLAGCNIGFLLRPATAAAAPDLRRGEYWLRTGHGELAVLAARSPLEVRDGEALQYVITALDIDARRRAERALAASRDELQALHASLDERIEGERASLARELHDELGALLTAVKTTLYLACARRLDGEAALREIGSLTDSLGEATSRIVDGLRPPVLDHFGIVAALDWYAREFTRRTGVACNARLPDDEPPLAPAAALALFRAAQECLTNVGRHAGATSVRVTLEAGRELVLTIADDGTGADPAAIASSDRFGLRGLRERLRALGGRLEIATSPGSGLLATVILPFPAHAPARLAAAP